jgi:hypothetical protein
MNDEQVPEPLAGTMATSRPGIFARRETLVQCTKKCPEQSGHFCFNNITAKALSRKEEKKQRFRSLFIFT